MLLYELTPPISTITEISASLRVHCAQFIVESGGRPLYKKLPATYGEFKRVKVRFQKKKNISSDVYEAAFGNGVGSFRERSVSAYGGMHPGLTEDEANYYIFPVDGYKFMYSKQIHDSVTAFEGVVDTLLSNLPLSDSAAIVTDLVKYSYQTTNLREGIDSRAEVILYDIPAFYAVNVSSYPNYNLLIL